MRSRQLSRLIPLIFLLTGVATGQIQFHFGVEAGVPLTDTLSSSTQFSVFGPSFSSSFERYNSETKRLLIGPTFRVETQSGLGIEVDALYQRVDDDFASAQFGAGQSFQATTANRWQVPVLVQYARSLAHWKARWFAEAGPSISHIGDSRSTISSTTISNGSTSSSTSSERPQRHLGRYYGRRRRGYSSFPDPLAAGISL